MNLLKKFSTVRLEFVENFFCMQHPVVETRDGTANQQVGVATFNRCKNNAADKYGLERN